MEYEMNEGTGRSFNRPSLRRDFNVDMGDVTVTVKFGIRMGLFVDQPKMPRVCFEDGVRYTRYGGDARRKYYWVQSVSAHERAAIFKAIAPLSS